MFTGVLSALGLALYIAAKIDFFRQYDRLALGAYLREHSVYWAAMAAIAFLIWIVERIFLQDPS